MSDTADRDDLAAILSEHYPIRDEGTEQVVCWCLWKPETRLYGFAEWDAVRAHVAQMVLESHWLRGVRAKELRDAADAVQAEFDRDNEEANAEDFSGDYNDGYVYAMELATTHLADRADRVDAEDGGR